MPPMDLRPLMCQHGMLGLDAAVLGVRISKQAFDLVMASGVQVAKRSPKEIAGAPVLVAVCLKAQHDTLSQDWVTISRTAITFFPYSFPRPSLLFCCVLLCPTLHPLLPHVQQVTACAGAVWKAPCVSSATRVHVWARKRIC